MYIHKQSFLLYLDIVTYSSETFNFQFFKKRPTKCKSTAWLCFALQRKKCRILRSSIYRKSEILVHLLSAQPFFYSAQRNSISNISAWESSQMRSVLSEAKVRIQHDSLFFLVTAIRRNIRLCYIQFRIETNLELFY